jgi:hypothetical protein
MRRQTMQYLRDEGLAYIWQSAGSVLGVCSITDAALGYFSPATLLRDGPFLLLASLWFALGTYLQCDSKERSATPAAHRARSIRRA